ncbi:MAG TPA: hypothetical protein VGO59_00700 [Verrucomicrobiae bacterium]
MKKNLLNSIVFGSCVMALAPSLAHAQSSVSSTLNLSSYSIDPDTGTATILSGDLTTLFATASESEDSFTAETTDAQGPSSTSASSTTSTLLSTGSALASSGTILNVTGTSSVPAGFGIPVLAFSSEVAGIFVPFELSEPATVTFSLPISSSITGVTGPNGIIFESGTELEVVIANERTHDSFSPASLQFLDVQNADPNQSISDSQSLVLTGSLTLDANTPYELGIEASAGQIAITEPLSVPDGGSAAWLLLGGAALLLIASRNRPALRPIPTR